jgi:hypothetical protein
MMTSHGRAAVALTFSLIIAVLMILAETLLQEH